MRENLTIKKEPLNVLMIAYVYPPDAGSGTFRSLYFSNYLSKNGAKIYLITVNIDDFHPDAAIDFDLMKEIDNSINISRCPVYRPLKSVLNIKKRFFNSWYGAKKISKSKVEKPPILDKKLNSVQRFKNLITDLLSLPDQHVGWVPHVLRSGKKIITKNKINCIYATGGPWSCLLSGALLKKATGIPLVSDFRDPWVENPNQNKKSNFIKYIENKLESFVVKNSNILIANTDELRKNFLKRYTSLEKNDVITITNGFERKNIINHKNNDNFFSIIHTGEVYMSRNPILLLEVIRDLVSEKIIIDNLFKLTFVGGFSADDQKLNELLNSPVLKKVIEIHSRVSHGKSLKFQNDASVLLLLQQNFPLQIPRKLFEYISMQKPLFCISEKNSATFNIVKNNSLGVVVENDYAQIRDGILYMYNAWRNKKLKSLCENNIDQFDNNVLGVKLYKTLNEVS